MVMARVVRCCSYRSTVPSTADIEESWYRTRTRTIVTSSPLARSPRIDECEGEWLDRTGTGTGTVMPPRRDTVDSPFARPL